MSRRKKVSFKKKDVVGPPDGSWVWNHIERMATDKWWRMPLMVHRLIQRIEIEQMLHKGDENGRLKIAYSQFVEWGMSRSSIAPAIRYAEDAGFIEVTKRGYKIKDTTNEYRLTYYATRRRISATVYEWSAPTDEWKRRGGKNIFLRPESGTALGQNPVLTGEPEMAETLDCGKNALGQNPVHSSRLSYPVPNPAPATAASPAARTAPAKPAATATSTSPEGDDQPTRPIQPAKPMEKYN